MSSWVLSASGNPTLPNGILFGGGLIALQQLGIEILGIMAVMVTVFVLSFVSAIAISAAMHGITNGYKTNKQV